MSDLDLSDLMSKTCAFRGIEDHVGDLYWAEFCWRGKSYAYFLCDDCFECYIEDNEGAEEGQPSFLMGSEYDLPYMLTGRHVAPIDPPSATSDTSYYRSPN
jgi:hypothetical protein